MNIGNALPIEDKFGSRADIIPQILRRKSILKTGKDRPLILDNFHVEKSNLESKTTELKNGDWLLMSRF